MSKSCKTVLFSGERREHPRIPYQRPVQCEAGGRLLRSEALNLGERGVSLEVSRKLPLHTRVTLRLPVWCKKGQVSTCELRGEVVRCSASRVGVQFKGVLPRHLLQLRDFVWRAGQATVTRVPPATTN